MLKLSKIVKNYQKLSLLFKQSWFFSGKNWQLYLFSLSVFLFGFVFLLSAYKNVFFTVPVLAQAEQAPIEYQSGERNRNNHVAVSPACAVRYLEAIK